MAKIKRKIIKIDEELCNGCGNCIPACPEQAIQIVDTPKGLKARLVKEFYCDGRGTCLGSCPQGALTIEEREAEAYDEEATIARIKEVAPEMLETHLKHLKEHTQELPEHHIHKMPKDVTFCPSAQMLHGEEKKETPEKKAKVPSELRQWPIQLHLAQPSAPYFQNADLLIVADCTPFAYVEKVNQIIKIANLKSIKVIHMEVPCCFGLVHIVKRMLEQAKKKIPFEEITVGIKGEIK